MKYFLRFAKTIDDCYSAVLFVHMLAATFQLCFETFQVYTVGYMTYIKIHFIFILLAYLVMKRLKKKLCIKL